MHVWCLESSERSREKENNSKPDYKIANREWKNKLWLHFSHAMRMKNKICVISRCCAKEFYMITAIMYEIVTICFIAFSCLLGMEEKFCELNEKNKNAQLTVDTKTTMISEFSFFSFLSLSRLDSMQMTNSTVYICWILSPIVVCMERCCASNLHKTLYDRHAHNVWRAYGKSSCITKLFLQIVKSHQRCNNVSVSGAKHICVYMQTKLNRFWNCKQQTVENLADQ